MQPLCSVVEGILTRAPDDEEFNRSKRGANRVVHIGHIVNNQVENLASLFKQEVIPAPQQSLHEINIDNTIILELLDMLPVLEIYKSSSVL